jgi:hypothetical protein
VVVNPRGDSGLVQAARGQNEVPDQRLKGVVVDADVDTGEARMAIGAIGHDRIDLTGNRSPRRAFSGSAY